MLFGVPFGLDAAADVTASAAFRRCSRMSLRLVPHAQCRSILVEHPRCAVSRLSSFSAGNFLHSNVPAQSAVGPNHGPHIVFHANRKNSPRLPLSARIPPLERFKYFALVKAPTGAGHESILPSFGASRVRLVEFCRAVICSDRAARSAGARRITHNRRCAGCRRRRFAWQARSETADPKSLEYPR